MLKGCKSECIDVQNGSEWQRLNKEVSAKIDGGERGSKGMTSSCLSG